MNDYLRKHRTHLSLCFLGCCVALLSYLWNYAPGLHAASAFAHSLREMILILPAVFVLIGLGDAWIPKELVARYTGHDSGWKSSFWMILLAMVQGGPLFASFPVAYLMWKKGTSPRNIFVYLGAFSTVKLPMLGIEIGFLGLKFTLLRSLFSIPVFLIIAVIMERWFGKNFEIRDGK